MTDSPTTETIVEDPVEEVVEETPAAESGAPKPLREALKREQAENAKLRNHILEGAYKDIGLDPETGLGKAIAKEYKGEASREALAEFAKTEYGHEPPTPQNPQAPVIQQEQARLDQAQAASGSVPPPADETEALKQASQAGDLKTAGAIKAAKLRRMQR